MELCSAVSGLFYNISYFQFFLYHIIQMNHSKQNKCSDCTYCRMLCYKPHNEITRRLHQHKTVTVMTAGFCWITDILTLTESTAVMAQVQARETCCPLSFTLILQYSCVPVRMSGLCNKNATSTAVQIFIERVHARV